LAKDVKQGVFPKVKKPLRALSLLLISAVLMSAVTMTAKGADVTYTSAQARSSWTFTASQLNAGVIFLHFTPVKTGSFDLSIRLNSPTFNATTTGGGYIDIYYNNETGTGSRLAIHNGNNPLTYYWGVYGTTVFDGTLLGYQHNNTKYNNAYDIVAHYKNDEATMTYFSDAGGNTRETTPFTIVTSNPNASYSAVNFVWLLTAGSITLTLTPKIGRAHV